MARRIAGERFIYTRPLDIAQIKANKIIINARFEDLYAYSKINKGSRVTVVDEFGREFKGKMDKGKNTYLHCLGWFQAHAYIQEGTQVLVSVSGDEKKRIFIGDLGNAKTLAYLTTNLPLPPEQHVVKRRPGRPPGKKKVG